jgi:TFIIF-interacting CTD phosphatase-like protein
MNRPQIAKPKYNNSDVTVIAVYQLGGALRYIHLEDVAVKAAELSPKAFSWKKYPDRINLETVRISLKNELEAKIKRVLGSIRHGWMLTPQGLSWCLENVSAETNQSPIEQIYKEIARMKKSEAFNKVTAGRMAEITDDNLNAVLRIDEYFSPRNRSERILAFANAAVIEPQLKPVLTTLKQRGFIEPEVEL